MDAAKTGVSREAGRRRDRGGSAPAVAGAPDRRHQRARHPCGRPAPRNRRRGIPESVWQPSDVASSAARREAARPVLRIGQDRRRARKLLGEARELPEELGPEVEARRQPWRPGLRESAGARRHRRRRARPGRDARSRAPAARARRRHRPGPGRAVGRHHKGVDPVAPGARLSMPSSMKLHSPSTSAVRIGSAPAGPRLGPVIHLDLGERIRIDQRQLRVGLADVDDQHMARLGYVTLRRSRARCLRRCRRRRRRPPAARRRPARGSRSRGRRRPGRSRRPCSARAMARIGSTSVRKARFSVCVAISASLPSW